MGIFSDLLVDGKAFGTEIPPTALYRRIHREFNMWVNRGDAEYFAEVLPQNEVQVISQFVKTPKRKKDSYRIDLTLATGEKFPSRDLTKEGKAADINTAIWLGGVDAGIPNWNPMSVRVSAGTSLKNSDIELTFQGIPVRGVHHGQTVLDTSDLKDKDFMLDDPPWYTSQPGQSRRCAWAALCTMGVCQVSNIPPVGQTPQRFVPVTNPGNNATYPSQVTLRALALEAAIEDDNAETEIVILESVGLPKL